MKSKKSFITILLLLIVVLALSTMLLVACGDKNKGENRPNNSDSIIDEAVITNLIEHFAGYAMSNESEDGFDFGITAYHPNGSYYEDFSEYYGTGCFAMCYSGALYIYIYDSNENASHSLPLHEQDEDDNYDFYQVSQNENMIVIEFENGIYDTIMSSTPSRNFLTSKEYSFAKNSITTVLSNNNYNYFYSGFSYDTESDLEFSLYSYPQIGNCYEAYSFSTDYDEAIVQEYKSKIGTEYTDDSYAKIENNAFYSHLIIKPGFRFEETNNGYTVSKFYYNSTETTITIPSEYNGKPVTNIGEYALNSLDTITSLIIPASVINISPKAFNNNKLASITIAEGNPKYHSANNCIIETGSKTLILGCNTSVIPADGSVLSIGDNAFSDCSGLTEITIPECIAYIGDYVFSDCDNLTTVNWNAIDCAFSGLVDWNNPFGDCNNLATINFGDNVAIIDPRGFNNSAGPTSIAVSKNNLKYHSEGNCIIETESKTLILGCKTSVIPTDGSVTSIEYGAFYRCGGLTSITIPESITYISHAVFTYCDNLTTVNWNAIECNRGIEDMWIPFFTGAHNITTINFGNNVAKIPSRAFLYCTGLTTITIPDNVTSIGRAAFLDCHGLTNVYYKGTAAEWTSINIEEDNTYLTNATRYYYSEEEPPVNDNGTDYDDNYWHYVDGVVTVWAKEN
ncbi:MAG: leucine-rich repeat domain-containing protein [Clostridiales bacterium]|nr:leucine-rich repeat domain-containing protein [Clostridiales bacterium]